MNIETFWERMKDRERQGQGGEYLMAKVHKLIDENNMKDLEALLERVTGTWVKYLSQHLRIVSLSDEQAALFLHHDLGLFAMGV